MELNILGTPYQFNVTTDREDTTLCGKGGYCDSTAKIIAIESDYNDKDQESVKDIEALKRKIKRHEIVHAYFFESGLSGYADNEQLVDWIAYQFPKMLSTFQVVDAI